MSQLDKTLFFYHISILIVLLLLFINYCLFICKNYLYNKKINYNFNYNFYNKNYCDYLLEI